MVQMKLFKKKFCLLFLEYAMMNFKLIMRNKIIQIVQTVGSIVSTRNNTLSSMQSIQVRCKIPFGLFALGLFHENTSLS